MTAPAPNGSTDRAYLRAALDEAQIALDAGDWPIGAVLVGPGGDVIARARNATRTAASRLHHAELQLLLANMPLVRAHEGRLTVYSTLEPCIMCLSALVMARIGRIVWACGDPFGGGTRLLRLDAWPPARRVDLVPEPFPDLKQASKQALLAYLERRGDVEKLALFQEV